MDRLASMQVFVKVVEIGSFAAAADIFGISAPMVGKHIRSLEGRLGVTLINRTTRRQNLTDLGRAYYERCLAILADIDVAEAMAAENLLTPKGRLRVTMPALLGRICVAPILLTMAASFPDLKLEMSFTDDMIDLADFDLAIRSLAENHGTIPGGAGMMTRRLSSHQMVVCASPNYLSRRGQPTTLAELETHELIIFGKHGRRQPWQFSGADALPVDLELPGRVVMDDLAAIADAAAVGLGLAWLPTWLIRRRIEEGELAVVPLNTPSLAYHNNALWHQAVMTPKIRLAIDHLTSDLPQRMDSRQRLK